MYYIIHIYDYECRICSNLYAKNYLKYILCSAQCSFKLWNFIVPKSKFFNKIDSDYRKSITLVSN